MLKLLRRWLGWDAVENPFDLRGSALSARPTSATRELFLNKAAAKPQAQRAQRKPVDAKSPAARKPKAQPAPRPDKPRLSVDKPPADRFDPYNTGAFNRSASWERISRSGR